MAIHGKQLATQKPGTASSLPVGHAPPLASVWGPTYLTAQLLVQQVAFSLSDKIFSYSPPTFDLDSAALAWSADGSTNVHGLTPTVFPLQTRTGAGTLALGYMFSPDFDMSRRNIPQTLLASSAALPLLRGSLDQLSLLYSVASPLVAHVAAADYSGATGQLAANYDKALRLADDLGLALVASCSPYEAQHMALFATVLSRLAAPALHVYDGVRTARETLRVVDVLKPQAVGGIYGRLVQHAENLSRHLDAAGKVAELLDRLNAELGSTYEPFEYHGHADADAVLVVFGSVEAQVAKEVVGHLAKSGVRVGTIVVRVYRPFIEEAFLNVLPTSARLVAVLGQVRDELAVLDMSVQSALYGDVLPTVVLGSELGGPPVVVDVKYAPTEAVTPAYIVTVLRRLLPEVAKAINTAPKPRHTQMKQYSFWDLDTSPALGSPAIIGDVLSRESTHVYVSQAFDNLVQGGAVRTDIRSSKTSIERPYAIEDADVVYVGDENLLKSVAIYDTVGPGGTIILRLPGFKSEDAEKRLTAETQRALYVRRIETYVLDTALSPAFEKDAARARLIIELAFLCVARPNIKSVELAELARIENASSTFAECLEAVQTCLSKLEVPAAWGELSSDAVSPQLPTTIQHNSFAAFDKADEEEEPSLRIDHWQTAAKGLLFKEAYGTSTGLRPDLSVKTYTVTVKENRRLTPTTYDRNIFHIEFDLGTSGLTYKIGEALGVHGDNDPAQVNDFIAFYGLDPDAVVAVPSREDPAGTFETRTVYQTLLQHLDILGKPPKRFYEALAEFATDPREKEHLARLGSAAGAAEFKRRSDVDTVTYVDVLAEFSSARPSFADLVRIVAPLKRREYSIASAQAVTPTSVALMIVVVDWEDTRGRKRIGHATRYLSSLRPGAAVTVSVKPSVMKLPARDDAPLIMAGLGTGLAPFRAFVQYRAMQRAAGAKIGKILLYLGSRHRREEYLYGEEWEAYLDAGVVTLLGAAFSRDQPNKIYIQDRMRQTLPELVDAYLKEGGSFYLCGPTWPVPDVTKILQEAVALHHAKTGTPATNDSKKKRFNPRKEIERLKEDGRYVLEVY